MCGILFVGIIAKIAFLFLEHMHIDSNRILW